MCDVCYNVCKALHTTLGTELAGRLLANVRLCVGSVAHSAYDEQVVPIIVSK